MTKKQIDQLAELVFFARQRHAHEATVKKLAGKGRLKKDKGVELERKAGTDDK